MIYLAGHLKSDTTKKLTVVLDVKEETIERIKKKFWKWCFHKLDIKNTRFYQIEEDLHFYLDQAQTSILIAKGNIIEEGPDFRFFEMTTSKGQENRFINYLNTSRVNKVKK